MLARRRKKKRFPQLSRRKKKIFPRQSRRKRKDFRGRGSAKKVSAAVAAQKKRFPRQSRHKKNISVAVALQKKKISAAVAEQKFSAVTVMAETEFWKRWSAAQANFSSAVVAALDDSLTMPDGHVTTFSGGGFLIILETPEIFGEKHIFELKMHTLGGNTHFGKNP